MSLVEIVRNSHLFADLNEEELAEISLFLRPFSKSDGELFFTQGEEGEDISGLLNGGGESSSDSAKEEDASEPDAEESSASEDEPAEIPEGVEVISMPRLSDTMEEGTVASWLKSVGDEVEEGDILAEIETDKATMEFESFYSGTLLHIGIQEGEGAPVDSLLAIIGEEGEDISGLLNGQDASGSGEETPAAKDTSASDTDANQPAATGSAEIGARTPPEGTRARPLAWCRAHREPDEVLGSAAHVPPPRPLQAQRSWLGLGWG